MVQVAEGKTLNKLDIGFEILRHEKFRVDHPFRSTRQIFGPSVLDVEGPGHVMRKRAWIGAFSRSEIQGERYQNIINRSVEEGLTYGIQHKDLMLAAAFIPNRVVLLLLGCDDVDPIEHFARLRPAIDYLETNEKTQALMETREYLREGPFKNATGIMDELPAKELSSELMLLAVAGAETTIVAMKTLLSNWILDPEEFAASCQKSGVEQHVLDLLKFDPPLGLATRYCRDDVEIGDQAFVKGDIVHVDIVAANQGKCPISGKIPVSELTFGSGRHSCPGHLLAKAELQKLSEALLALDSRNFEAEGVLASVRPLNFRHPSGLTIRPRP